MAAALALALSASPGAAEDNGDTRETEQEETLYLRPLERFRVDARGSFLTIADFNSDGRNDFAVMDPGKSILHLYYSEQDAEHKSREFRLDGDGDWVWRVRKLVVANKASALAAGDFNGDGRTDLAIAAQDGAGTIHYQGEDGLEEQPEPLPEPARQLAAADLNEDGRHDLLLAGDKGLSVVLQGEDGSLESARRLSVSASPQDAMILQDMDGDGLKDLFFVDPSSRETAIIRFGMGGGDFGPESRRRLGDSMATVGLGGGRVAVLDPNTRAIGVLELAPSSQRAGSGSVNSLPLGDAQVLPLPSDLAGGTVSMAPLETKCRPGVVEALIGLSKGAQLLRLTRGDVGRFHFEEFPSFSDVIGVASAGDGVYVLSGREKTLGRLSCESLEDLAKFPEPVALEDTPLAIASGVFDAHLGEMALWRVFREGDDEDEDLTVEALSLASPPAKLGSVAMDETFDFAPEKLMVADANNDGLGDFLVFFEYEDPRLYLQSEPGEFKRMESDQALKRGLLSGLRPLDVTFGDWDADGETEMIIAREGYLRAYHLDPAGALTIEKQFNARSRSAKLTAPIVMDVDDDGQADLLAIEDGEKLAAFLAADPAQPRSAKIPKIDVRSAIAGDFTADGRADLLLLGSREVALFEGGGAAMELAARERLMTDVKDGLYSGLAAGPLFGEGEGLALIAVEARENMMEFLKVKEDGGLRSVYRFQVFNDPRPRDDARLRRFGSEPREIVVADVDGDGLMDLAALAHESVLVYRQSAGKPEAP